MANKRRYDVTMERRVATRVSVDIYNLCKEGGEKLTPALLPGTFARNMADEALKALRANDLPPEAPPPYYRDMNLMLPPHIADAIDALVKVARRKEKRVGPGVILRRLIWMGLQMRGLAAKKMKLVS